jgi:hypothetical protein
VAGSYDRWINPESAVCAHDLTGVRATSARDHMSRRVVHTIVMHRLRVGRVPKARLCTCVLARSPVHSYSMRTHDDASLLTYTMWVRYAQLVGHTLNVPIVDVSILCK